MTRKLGILAAVLATLAITTSVALAALTWHSGPTLSWNNDGSATASGNLSGLGNTPAIAYLTITSEFRYTCQNPGGNVAPGQKSVAVVGAPGSQQLGPTSKNGRSSLSVTAYPGTPASEVSGNAAGCPNGNWKGVNPTATGSPTAHLEIWQGGNLIYAADF